MECVAGEQREVIPVMLDFDRDSNPDVREFMMKKGFHKDYPRLESYYMEK